MTSKVLFPVWRTIRHVGRRDAESYCAGLSTSFHTRRSGDWLRDLIGRFETTSIDEEVDLGCAYGAELGIKEATQIDVICDRIVTLGGSPCLPEDGPVLREQYLDQPKGEWLFLAMKAIRDADYGLSIFSVVHHESGLWLGWHVDSPRVLFFPEEQFVFRLRKRPLAA